MEAIIVSSLSDCVSEKQLVFLFLPAQSHQCPFFTPLSFE